MQADDSLPEPLPSCPLPLFSAWFGDAQERRAQPNPDAMVLATVAADRQPSARVVLCKQISVDEGYVVFFTNYASRKGRELAAHAHCAAVFHWDALHRQVRIEGQVLRSPQQESDAYFAMRALDSRIGAWASQQSEPLESRAALAEQVRGAATRLGVPPGATDAVIPRPSHWGGHRLWIERIELWVEGANRVHDRAVWARTLTRRDEFSFTASSWSATRLNP